MFMSQRRMGERMLDNNPYSVKQVGTIMSRTHCFRIMKYLAEHEGGTRKEIGMFLFGDTERRNVIHWTLRRMRDLGLLNRPTKKEALEFGLIERYTLTDRGKKLFMTVMDYVKLSNTLPSFTMEMLQKKKAQLEKNMKNVDKEIEQEKQLKSTKQMKSKNEVY